MIDEKKIEKIAQDYAWNNSIPEEDGKNTFNIMKAFKAGVNWFKENLWHDASEEPERVEEILIEQEINGKKQHQAYMFNGASFFHEHCRKCGVTRWLYIEDLMKGDKK